MGGSPGQKVGSSLNVEQPEGRMKNKWEHVLSYLVKCLLVEKCIVKSVPVTLASLPRLTSLWKGMERVDCTANLNAYMCFRARKTSFRYLDKTPQFKTISYLQLLTHKIHSNQITRRLWS